MPGMDLVISSTANPRVKYIAALNTKRQRDADGVMLIEGHDPLALALSCGISPSTVFICPELHKPAHSADAHEALLARARASGAEIVSVTRLVFEKMAYRDGPDGWLALAARPAFDLAGLSAPPPGSRGGGAGSPALLLVAEQVEKPGNLGAMLRTCDAAGVNGFVTVDPVADLSNPNVVRASQGALFSVPVAQCTQMEALSWLRARGIAIVATTPNDIGGRPPLEYTAFDFTKPCAILMGEEKYGLSEFWLRNADAAVRIPMTGRINSLNVATSAALVIYEALRQRRA